MPGSLGAAHLALLAKASPCGVAAADEAEARLLCTLVRVGLLAPHAAGIHVLTDAGRRYLAIEAPPPVPPSAD